MNFRMNLTFCFLLVCLVGELSGLLEDHCTDVSYYTSIEYTTNTKQCCKPELKEFCEYKREDVCKDVLEVQCQPKARVECRRENSFVSGKKCEVELKNYDYKNCQKKVNTRIECKQSAVNSCKPKLKVYEDGHAKFNGEVSCTPLFYEDCVVVDEVGCTCSEFTNSDGVGKCRGRVELGGSVAFGGQVACYVNLPSSCKDMVESETNPGKYLSAEACNCENVDKSNTVAMEACGQVPLGRHWARYNRLEDSQIYGQASSSLLPTCTTPFQVKWADFTEKEKPMMKEETVCEVKSSVECQRVSVTKCTSVDYKECSWRPVQQCEAVSVSEPTQEKIHRKKCLKTETEEELNISCGFDDDKHLSVEDESNSGLSLVLQTDWFTWDNGKVPYYFKGSVTDGDRKLILGVMEEIERHTCFKYIPHDTEPAGHHLEIEINPRSCETFSAYVDNRPDNRDKVIFFSHFQLTNCVRQLDTRLGVLHELMHTFGVMHTQKRRDRDQFITVQWENILAKAKDQYRICDKCEIFPGIGYDCGSIMHYGYQTFSRNKFVKTMESNDDSKCKLSPNGPAFATNGKPSQSDWDVLQILGGLVCDKRQGYARKGRTRVYVEPEEEQEIVERSYPLKVMDRDSGLTLATVDQVREHMEPVLKDLEKACGPWCVARIEGARVRGPGFSRNIVPINPTQEEQLEIVTIPEF